MTLEQCVERDMIAFLEKETAGEEEKVVPRHEDTALLYLNREWQREIDQALKRNDIAAAKKIFNLLKTQYEETAADHPVERRKRYEQLQEVYIQIVNFLQDNQRTNLILERLENNADAVFDAQVKPVNLDDLQRGPRLSLPDYETVSKKSLAANPAHGSLHAAQFGIDLPPSPDLSVAPPAPSPKPMPLALSVPVPPSMTQRPAVPQPFTLPKPPASAPPPKQLSAEEREAKRKDVLASIKSDLQRAVTLSKTREEQAKELLAALRERLTTAQREGVLTQAESGAIAKDIEQLAAATDAYHERRSFEADFRKHFTALASLARLKHSDAITTLASMRVEAAAFEERNAEMRGTYTNQLDRLKDTYKLYTEDELVAKLKPLLQALAKAKTDSDAAAMRTAISNLEQFVRSLPHTPSKMLLERLVTTIRSRLSRAIAAAPRKTDQSGQLADRLRAAIEHIKRASRVRDYVGVMAGAVEMNRLALSVPPGPDRDSLTKVAGSIMRAVRSRRIPQ